MTSVSSAASVVVVGAGASGRAAATSVAEQGLNVVLIDEGSISDPLQPGIAARPNTLVWGLFRDHQVALIVDGDVELICPEAIILATGARDRLAAFPGWTLPGVRPLADLQSEIDDRSLVGAKCIVAGTGSELLSGAAEIARRGGQVVAVVDGRPSPSASAGDDHLGAVERELRASGVPIHTQSMVVAARGAERIDEVTIASIDDSWNVVAGSEQTLAADMLVLHYGFVASLELARMIECVIEHDPARGGWYVSHDAGMRTSQPGIYAAGEISGIGTTELATATGRLAGLSAAADLGALNRDSYDAACAALQSEIAALNSELGRLNLANAPAPAIASLIQPETIICPCEQITAQDIADAVAEGAVTFNDFKRRTRCGMGMCQARTCLPILAAYIEHTAGYSPTDVGLMTSRPPVKPIPLSALAAASTVG